MKQPLGGRIRDARERRGISQREMAKRMGVGQAYVSYWENGRYLPSVEQLHLLEQVLGTSIADAESLAAAAAAPRLEHGRRKKTQSALVEHQPQTPAPKHRASKPKTAEAVADPVQSHYGVWLNEHMIERGVKAAQLAAASGVSVPAIYNILSGRSGNPQSATRKALEAALGARPSAEIEKSDAAAAAIEGIGSLTDFDPHDEEALPTCGGVYVFYDVSDRPIYVGESGTIRKRVMSHGEKFWFKRPIVETASYIKIEHAKLRRQVEQVLIRFLKTNAVINKLGVTR